MVNDDLIMINGIIGSWWSVIIAELQIKPKIWRGSIIAWFLSFFLVRHDQDSSDVTLAFEDAD